MKYFTALLIAVLSAPVTALISSAVMSKLWLWYAARDYGAGPSYAAWYGLNVILGVAIMPSLAGLAQRTEKEGHPVQQTIGNIIGVWIGMGVILLFAWFTGMMLGWI